MTEPTGSSSPDASRKLLLEMARDWLNPAVVRDAPERVPHVIEQLIAEIERLAPPLRSDGGLSDAELHQKRQCNNTIATCPRETCECARADGGAQPDSVLDANKRMREPERAVELTEAQKPIAEWLKARRFIEDRYVLAIAWSDRLGYDHRDLEFYPLRRHENDSAFDVIIGCHASGENPRLIIGTCETLADVQMVYETIRRINGYKKPEDERLRASDGGSLPLPKSVINNPHESRSPDGDGLSRGDSGSNPDFADSGLAGAEAQHAPHDASEMPREAHDAAPCTRAGSEPADSHTTTEDGGSLPQQKKSTKS